MREFILSLSYKQQSKVRRALFLLQEYGIYGVVPHVKRLRGVPLWEIRILGGDNIRIFYAAFEKESVLVLHGFVKQTQKTPDREISTAMSRYRDWKARRR